VFALLLSLPTWAVQVWSIDAGTVNGGHLEFYSDVELTNWSQSALSGDTIYIKAIPDVIHIVEGVQITAEKCLPSGAAQSRTRGIGFSEPIAVTAVEGKPGVYSLVMPKGYNVTVSATFAEKPTTSVKYLDAEGKEQTASGVYTLDGTEQEIGVSDKETWYVVNSDIEFTKCVFFNGDVHLILADGCKMNMTVTDMAAIANKSNVVIYGQTLGTGSLAIDVTTNDNHYAPSGIYANNLTINGGIINITAHDALLILSPSTADR
jgi:hypothetical protein